MTKRDFLDELILSLNEVIHQLMKVEGATVAEKAALHFVRGELESARRHAEHEFQEEVIYQNVKNTRPVEIPRSEQIF